MRRCSKYVLILFSQSIGSSSVTTPASTAASAEHILMTEPSHYTSVITLFFVISISVRLSDYLDQNRKISHGQNFAIGWIHNNY